jgi:hypothetical protein
MAVAPVAPAAVSLSMFALGIGAACVFVLLLGLRWAWQYTFGALLEALANVRINLPGRHDLHPLRWLRAYNTAVQNDIERRLEKSHRAMGYFFHGAAIILEWTAREVAGLAADTLHFGQSLSHVRLPRLTRAMIIAAFPLPWLARRVAALVAAHAIPAARVTNIRRGINRRTVAAMIAAAVGVIEAPHLPHLRLPGALRDLGKWRTQVGRRLRRLEWLLSAAGAAALVTVAFKRLGLRCLLGRNGKTIGKTLCRFDADLLDALMLGGLVITGLSVVEFAKELQTVEDEALRALHRLVREFPDPRQVSLTGSTFPH